MPEYLKKRFGGNRCQIYLATQNMLLFIFVKLSVSFLCHFHKKNAATRNLINKRDGAVEVWCFCRINQWNIFFTADWQLTILGFRNIDERNIRWTSIKYKKKVLGTVYDAKIFVFQQAEIYAGSIIIQQTLGWSLYASVLMLLIITAFYTLVGKLLLLTNNRKQSAIWMLTKER